MHIAGVSKVIHADSVAFEHGLAKNVAAQLYVVCGISGAIQHLAGMKDPKVTAA